MSITAKQVSEALRLSQKWTDDFPKDEEGKEMFITALWFNQKFLEGYEPAEALEIFYEKTAIKPVPAKKEVIH